MDHTLTVTVPDGTFTAYVALAAQSFTAISPDLFWRDQPGLQRDDHNPDDWTKALAICQATTSRVAPPISS